MSRGKGAWETHHRHDNTAADMEEVGRVRNGLYELTNLRGGEERGEEREGEEGEEGEGEERGRGEGGRRGRGRRGGEWEMSNREIY